MLCSENFSCIKRATCTELYFLYFVPTILVVFKFCLRNDIVVGNIDSIKSSFTFLISNQMLLDFKPLFEKLEDLWLFERPYMIMNDRSSLFIRAFAVIYREFVGYVLLIMNVCSFVYFFDTIDCSEIKITSNISVRMIKNSLSTAVFK